MNKPSRKTAFLLACSCLALVACGGESGAASSESAEGISSSAPAETESEEAPIVFEAHPIKIIRESKEKNRLGDLLGGYYAFTGVVTLKDELPEGLGNAYFYLQDGADGLAVQYSASSQGKEFVEVGKTLTVRGLLSEHGGFPGEAVLRTTYSGTRQQGEILVEGEASFAPFDGIDDETFASYFASYVRFPRLEVLERGTFANRPSLLLGTALGNLSFRLHATEASLANEELQNTLEGANVGDRVEFEGIWLCRDTAKGRYVTMIASDVLRVVEA